MVTGSLLLLIIITLVVLGLALYAVSLLTMIQPPIRTLITVLLIVLAIAVILGRSGLLASSSIC